MDASQPHSNPGGEKSHNFSLSACNNKSVSIPSQVGSYAIRAAAAMSGIDIGIGSNKLICQKQKQNKKGEDTRTIAIAMRASDCEVTHTRKSQN